MRSRDLVRSGSRRAHPASSARDRGHHDPKRWIVVAAWVAGVGTACRGAGSSADASADGVAQQLAACEQRLTELEEDDRLLFAEAAADLERGWNDAACARFETLLRRFPTSPLVPEAKNRIERCRNGGGPLTAVRGAPSPSEPEPPVARAGPTGSDTAASGSAGAGANVEPETADANGDAPLEISRTWLKEDRFGVPLANLRLTNRSGRTVVGYKVALRCYDDRGTALKHLTKGTTWFIAAGGSRQGGPGEAFAGGPWPLTGFLGAARIEAVVLSVDYADGTHWQREDLAKFSANEE